MGWVVNATPRPLNPWERDPVPIVQEAVWAPGPAWTCVKNIALAGVLSFHRPVRSESLHRLCYPGPLSPCGSKFKNAWSYSYTFYPSYAFVMWCLMKRRDIILCFGSFFKNSLKYLTNKIRLINFILLKPCIVMNHTIHTS
jgi:hypothetical protein